MRNYTLRRNKHNYYYENTKLNKPRGKLTSYINNWDGNPICYVIINHGSNIPKPITDTNVPDIQEELEKP